MNDHCNKKIHQLCYKYSQRTKMPHASRQLPGWCRPAGYHVDVVEPPLHSLPNRVQAAGSHPVPASWQKAPPVACRGGGGAARGAAAGQQEGRGSGGHVVRPETRPEAEAGGGGPQILGGGRRAGRCAAWLFSGSHFLHCFSKAYASAWTID
jgi:hypothetical protein